MRLDTAPAHMTSAADLCDCFMLTGAHDERCAWVRWLRAGGNNDDDLEFPAFLRRLLKTDEGAFG